MLYEYNIILNYLETESGKQHKVENDFQIGA